MVDENIKILFIELKYFYSNKFLSMKHGMRIILFLFRVSKTKSCHESKYCGLIAEIKKSSDHFLDIVDPPLDGLNLILDF